MKLLRLSVRWDGNTCALGVFLRYRKQTLQPQLLHADLLLQFSRTSRLINHLHSACFEFRHVFVVFDTMKNSNMPQLTQGKIKAFPVLN